MRWLLILFSGLFALSGFSQNAFVLPQGRHKVTIPFRLINNLIFIEVRLNGTPLTFLLDSGVDETILFNLEQNQEVELKSSSGILLRGLGGADAVKGLKSSGNRLEIGKLRDQSHLLYIVLEKEFNFSAHVGIPVHGIVGYSFFADHLVHIDYASKKIIVSRRDWGLKRKQMRNFQRLDISIDRNKPYVKIDAELTNATFPARMLIDTGNSEALWLFQGKGQEMALPDPNVEDYLGHGFSGEVRGFRGRIEGCSIGGFHFERPIVAFPDQESIRHVQFTSSRLGSVGGEILKRFTVIFDYKGGGFYLKPNHDLDKPFEYNMSGLSIEHDGFEWVQKRVAASGKLVASEASFSFTFELKPSFKIYDVRKNSPAEKSGLLKGDIIVSIDGKAVHNYSLQEIGGLLKSRPGKEVRMIVRRKGEEIQMAFRLERIL